MIIRPAMLQDEAAIFELAMEQTQRYPLLKPSEDKIRQKIRLAISSAQHLCLVAEDAQKQVCGTLVAFSADNVWAQRQFSAVNLWVSKLPGGGAALLRCFRDWVKKRPAIRVAGLVLDLETDWRVDVLIRRIGFHKQGGTYLLYTRGTAHGTV